ncbi:VAN3-binding protein [Actinidia chinensis var. chinensis]|uniref:VAN3-binding protein n=1 Tax=Actinidia chinensis var. chinensis TaxID=1590841 RepID=A0A2R6QPP6_ACTCC|nr:VAN3-binding protein [Actinidia chinensis var. chinensis]
MAAAIAGFTRNCNPEAQDILRMTHGGGTLAWDQDMGVVVASAATLLTTVCAEAAKSLGAKRARVAYAVKSGLVTQTPIDVITLTATAATYKIINVIEEIKEAEGINFLALKTNKGIIKLFFEDEKQSIIWISTISNLLQMHNSC